MSKEELTIDETRDMMIYVANKVIESEPILTDADRALGDGDHGIGMKRGMTAVKESLDSSTFESVGDVFISTGSSMLSSMGGASGAIFGMFFRSGGKILKEDKTLKGDKLSLFLNVGTKNVMERGKAKVGDKTMVDSLFAASSHCEKELQKSNSVYDLIVAADKGSQEGKESTRDMVATMGRAKTLGDKSLGKLDAGAISVSIIIQAMKDYISNL